MAFFTTARDTLFGVASFCFPNPTLNINRRTFKVIKLLGEGGFSYVYLVKDPSTGQLYALKKIRCAPESGAVKDAMKEVEMYRLFQHENIIKVLDTCVAPDQEGGKSVYIFLPYYKAGNLQDAINDHLVNQTHFDQKYILKVFRQICYAVRELHTYQLRNVPDLVLNGNKQQAEGGTEIEPFAHRDIKPSNVLLSDDGETPVLMDFGSLVRARIKVQNRQQALTQQDLAGEHSTLPYRAPELFDVQTNTELTEKVDIWSLGCTLYATAYGKSPFETSMTEQGGSLALAVLNAQFRFPDADMYTAEFRDLISFMLVADPKDRPDIHQVIEKVDGLLESMDA